MGAIATITTAALRDGRLSAPGPRSSGFGRTWRAAFIPATAGSNECDQAAGLAATASSRGRIERADTQFRGQSARDERAIACLTIIVGVPDARLESHANPVSENGAGNAEHGLQRIVTLTTSPLSRQQPPYRPGARRNL